MLQLALGLWICLVKSAERLANFGRCPAPIGFAGLFAPREGFAPTTAFVRGLSTTPAPVAADFLPFPRVWRLLMT